MKAKEFIENESYDVVILDIILPRKSGLELLRELRRESNDVKVILLSALDSVEQKVKGLDCGADDYLAKPFAFIELMARIRVVTRRSAGRLTNVFEVGDLTLNTDSHIVTRSGDRIELSNKEFAILEYLIRNEGIVLSRDSIGRNAWDLAFDGESNIVDVYIRYLRRKIDDNYNNKLIHTIRGAGYVLRNES